MKTLLVIAPNPTLAAAIRAALDPARYRILQQTDLQEDELLLTASSVDACILDVDLTTIEPIRMMERIRGILPQCPMILYTIESHREWEEDAYVLGARHVLPKPVRARLLNALMDRIFTTATAVEPRLPAGPLSRMEPQAVIEPSQIPVRTLELLRSYSSILTHSLCADSLLKEFLLLLRKITGVNRTAIFMRPQPGSISETAAPSAVRRMRSACAIGLPSGVLEHFELSLETGIGGHVFRSGRILRRHSAEADHDPKVRKEFELLGAQVAIPILDRESLVGVAVFDGRVTGDLLGNEELALLFHLLEQLGMAVQNIWLHQEVSANHEMMADILRQLHSGCVVIGSDFTILHSNETARSYFPRAKRSPEQFEFSDLPQTIGSKVFQVLKTGKAIPNFKYLPPELPDKRFQIAIAPFRKDNSALPAAALLVIEDVTQSERLQNLEIETANLRLVRQMAERFAHEIGNAIVPISTHQQLLEERMDDPDFQQSLAIALQDGVKRVTRLVNQMRFLARDRVDVTEAVSVKKLIEEAFREARAFHPANTVLLQFESSGEPLTLTCDRVGLQHAFAEIILNALQANTQSCQVQVRTRTETDSAGSKWAQIEVQDSGIGFTAEAAGKVPEPFFTTRNVGLGLGLAVTNKIIQTHCGKLEIPAPRTGQPGLVRISLPLGPATPAPETTTT